MRAAKQEEAIKGDPVRTFPRLLSSLLVRRHPLGNRVEATRRLLSVLQSWLLSCAPRRLRRPGHRPSCRPCGSSEKRLSREKMILQPSTNAAEQHTLPSRRAHDDWQVWTRPFLLKVDKTQTFMGSKTNIILKNNSEVPQVHKRSVVDR